MQVASQTQQKRRQGRRRRRRRRAAHASATAPSRSPWLPTHSTDVHELLGADVVGVHQEGAVIGVHKLAELGVILQGGRIGEGRGQGRPAGPRAAGSMPCRRPRRQGPAPRSSCAASRSQPPEPPARPTHRLLLHELGGGRHFSWFSALCSWRTKPGSRRQDF